MHEGPFGDTVLSHPDGTSELLNEIIGPTGRVLDAKWGATKRATTAVPHEPTRQAS